MPRDNPPRWVTFREPFDYRWPSVNAVTAFPVGERLVKAQVADAAVAAGKATEGKADGSDAKKPSRKPRKRGSKATSKPAPAIVPSDAAPLTGPDAGMGGTDLASADRVDAKGAVGPLTGE